MTREQDRFAVVAGRVSAGARIWRRSTHVETDFVAVAERFLGTPYLWGGKTSYGLDCSGLVQVALDACGIACPRDSDMQERGARHADRRSRTLRRGDLVFWKGHVAIVRDADARCCTPTRFTWRSAIEPIAEAIARISAAAAKRSVTQP